MMHERRRHRGFSIIEATLAVLLVGGALVAALNVSAAASRTAAAASDRRTAEQLAHMLMAEVLAQPASGANPSNGASGTRLDVFNHVLDYNGFRESPPTMPDGTACAPAGWAWQVTISARAAEEIDGRMLDLKMLLVTVRVELPDGTYVALRALRARASGVDRASPAATEALLGVPITITMDDGTVRRANPAVRMNRPPDDTEVRKEVR